METDSSLSFTPPSPDASAVHSDDTIDLSSDDDDDDDSNGIDTMSVHSVSSGDSEQLHDFSDENLNDDVDRGSSVDIYESRTPSPRPADTAAAADADTATAVQSETGSVNMPASTPAAENALTHHVPLVSDLDDSVSCFKMTKRKKQVLSPPVNKDDEADEAEVYVSFKGTLWHRITYIFGAP